MLIVIEDEHGSRVSHTIPGPIPRWFGRALEALVRADTLLRAAPADSGEHGAQILLNIKGASVSTSVTQHV